MKAFFKRNLIFSFQNYDSIDDNDRELICTQIHLSVEQLLHHLSKTYSFQALLLRQHLTIDFV